MIYGYIRVSSITQNIDRQVDDIVKFGIEEKNIYTDKQSGKDFKRAKYLKLRKKLKKDDLLVVKSIDRLGRDYKMIIEEWAYITKTIGADILVLDMPLLDTRTKAENLVGQFISDIVLQVLSFVAQNERENIRARQAEGIRLARIKGIHLGRPALPIPDNFKQVATDYIERRITNYEARALLNNMTKGTFFRNMTKLKINQLSKKTFKDNKLTITPNLDTIQEICKES